MNVESLPRLNENDSSMMKVPTVNIILRSRIGTSRLEPGLTIRITVQTTAVL